MSYWITKTHLLELYMHGRDKSKWPRGRLLKARCIVSHSIKAGSTEENNSHYWCIHVVTNVLEVKCSILCLIRNVFVYQLHSFLILFWYQLQIWKSLNMISCCSLTICISFLVAVFPTLVKSQLWCDSFLRWWL